MKENKAILTVFTPTYNRRHTLERTYASLCMQGCKSFIWLIIDDGSSDDTSEYVNRWQHENCGFEIRYIYKENGGMHTAHNTAYENIDTELNICIDSDDLLAENAIELILNSWHGLEDTTDIAGIIGLDADFSGNIIGTGFPSDMRYTTLSGYYADGGKGDKKLVYRTDIMKNLPPYPVFEGEKYNSLAYKYLLCDQKYKLYVLNEVLCLVEYQPDGSTKTMFRQYINNPRGFAFTRRIDMLYPVSIKRLIMTGIHYCSSSLIAHDRHFIAESPRKILTVACFIPGVVLTIYIYFSVWKEDIFSAEFRTRA